MIKASADGKIEDTGPLTKKRMETIDDETSAAAIDFIDRQAKADKPFFCWFNSTRMHFRTHVRAGPPQRTPGSRHSPSMPTAWSSTTVMLASSSRSSTTSASPTTRS